MGRAGGIPMGMGFAGLGAPLMGHMCMVILSPGRMVVDQREGRMRPPFAVARSQKPRWTGGPMTSMWRKAVLMRAFMSCCGLVLGVCCLRRGGGSVGTYLPVFAELVGKGKLSADVVFEGDGSRWVGEREEDQVGLGMALSLVLLDTNAGPHVGRLGFGKLGHVVDNAALSGVHVHVVQPGSFVLLDVTKAELESLVAEGYLGGQRYCRCFGDVGL